MVKSWTYIYWTASSALCANEFDFAPAADTLSCLLPASPVECKWRSSCTDQNVKKRWQQLLHAIVDCACTSEKCRGLSTEGNRMESPFACRSKRNSQNIDTWKFANPMDAFKVCRNTRNNPTGACKCCSITVCILKVSCLNQMCLLLLLSALTIYLFLSFFFNLVYLIV